MLADRRLCLDRSLSRLVEESDPDAHFMVAAKGHEVPLDLVKRLDLRVRGGRVVQGPEPVAPKPAPPPAVEVAPLDGIVHPAGAMPEPKAQAEPKAEAKAEPKPRGGKKPEA